MLARAIWDYGAALRTGRYTPRELSDLQDRKARALVRYAFDSIAFYHDRIRSIGKVPSDFQKLSDLRSIPVLTRGEAHENAQRLVNPDVKVGYVRQTSGTTGRPLVVPWATTYCDLMMAVRTRRLKAIGARWLDKAASVFYYGADMSTPGAGNPRPRHQLSRIYKFVFGYPDVWIPLPRHRKIGAGLGNMKEVASLLLEMRPDILSARPSYARRLGKMLKDDGTELSLRQLYIGSEFTSKATRDELRSAFHAELFEAYGSQELGMMGYECANHQGIHIASDFYAFEVLRGGEPVSAEGEQGEVVFTAFDNPAMPLIRYTLGDVVILGESGRCACGSYLPRISSIEGRSRDGLVTASGLRLPPAGVVSYFETDLGLRDYQVVQKTGGRLLIRLKEADLSCGKTTDAIIDYARRLLGEEHLAVQFESWKEDDIPAKYRPVVCEAGST